MRTRTGTCVADADADDEGEIGKIGISRELEWVEVTMV
jgi:hypothetical protein